MFEKIVVGVDGSEASKRALTFACDLAKRYSADLHLVNAPREEAAALVAAGYGGYGALASIPLETHIEEVGQRIVDEAVKTAKDFGIASAQGHVEIGVPSEVILDLAKFLDADLIVTGKRGLGSVATFVLGSTSLQIAKNANCAFLSVN